MAGIKLAYGHRDDIDQSIESGKIPKGCLILTDDSTELFFYDLGGELIQYENKYKFDDIEKAKSWVRKYNCQGQIFSVHEGDSCNLYIVNHRDELEPLNNSKGTFIVNVTVYTDGTVELDKTDREISSAYYDGKSVLAYVKYYGGNKGDIIVSMGETINVLTLVNVDRMDASYKFKFTNIDRPDDDSYQVTCLWNSDPVYNYDIGEFTEVWKIETVTLPSKDYVDSLNTAFIVTGNITYNSSGSMYPYIFTNMSATYEEIKTAIEEGKEVSLKLLYQYAQQDGRYLYANFSRIDSDGWITFECCTHCISDYNDKNEYGYLDIWCESDSYWRASHYPYATLHGHTGDPLELETTNKRTLVGAINEVNAKVDDQIGEIETALDNIIAKYGLGGDVE